jgi:Membrane bound O-acyl transferase family
LAFVPADWPRWALMLAMLLAELVGVKWLTWRRTFVGGVPRWRQAAYLLAWPGLDAATFLGVNPVTRAERPAAREWAAALANIAGGIAVCWGLSRLVPEGGEVLLGWVGMVGLLLLVHCGLFRLLSCGWRALDIEARPLMDRPLVSVSVSEFWGKRWNTAFRDVVHRFLFRPLIQKLGPRWAIWVVFAISGLIHELVISVPARGGYGGPTLYFLLQALMLFVERSRCGRALGLGHGLRGWVFTMLLVIVPAWCLFHPPFLHNVVVPFMRTPAGSIR